MFDNNSSNGVFDSSSLCSWFSVMLNEIHFAFSEKIDNNATSYKRQQQRWNNSKFIWQLKSAHRLPLTLCYKLKFKIKSTECNLMAQHWNEKFDHIHFENRISFVNDRQQTVSHIKCCTFQFFIISYLCFFSAFMLEENLVFVFHIIRCHCCQ